MTCIHLRKLVQLCQDEKLKLSSSDLVHFVCEQCGEQEVCPSVLMDEYDARPEHSQLVVLSGDEKKPQGSGPRREA